ncbi:MAG TPA: SIMPL domain-containing protein [Gemmatimonadaceae bacterium]|nr:SIMPL domain-containing protein [Gemmatimonadaceae bacterium]
MRHLMTVVLAVASATLVPNVIVAQSPSTTPPQIIATGMGEASISPDRATIFVGVQTRANTVGPAAADNARRQRAILDTLRALGLGADQLSTLNYSVTPEMQYAPNQPPRVTGYVVRNTVRANVRRIDEVGKVIDAALAKGANEISSLQFFSSKADSVRRVAMAEAVTNARADAEAIARAAGGNLGQLLEATTAAFPRPIQEIALGKAQMAAAAPTPIEPGEQTISVTVTARWAFVPGR